LEAAKQGDEDAFAAIWREFHPLLLRYLKVKAAPDAEDLAADTWHRVIRALPGFEGDEDNFRGWLYTSARNRLTDWYRGTERRPTLVDRSRFVGLPAGDNVETVAEENASTDVALTMIAELPPDQAEAVMLRVIVGLDVPSVARIMKRSPGSVRVLCHRGLRRLERALEGVQPVSASQPMSDLHALDPTGTAFAVGTKSVAIGMVHAQEGLRHG
jgi:RNA polymerase sigma-70 factor (ECF subfamily)